MIPPNQEADIKRHQVLSALNKRIEQHEKFFNTLEGIRWQFTSAFGAGTGFGFFVTLVGEPSFKKIIVGNVLVIGLGLAAIVAQIRIYALIVVIWKRMVRLQEAEFHILKCDLGVDEKLRDAFLYPRIGVFKSRTLHLFTVGIISCLVFTLTVGIAVALILHTVCLTWASILSGSLTSLLLAMASVFGSKAYIAAIEKHDDNPAVQTILQVK